MTQWLGYLGAVALVCAGAGLNAPTAPAEPVVVPVVAVAEPEPVAPPAAPPAADPQAPPSGG